MFKIRQAVRTVASRYPVLVAEVRRIQVQAADAAFTRKLARTQGFRRRGRLLDIAPSWIVAAQPGPKLGLYIRILAIEEFAGRNSVGASLYNRFMGGSTASARRSSDGFADLYASVVKYGLLDSQPLRLHGNLVLGNGWHRLACAMVLGYETVPTTACTWPWRPWISSASVLRECGFTAVEIELVDDARHRYGCPWLDAKGSGAAGSAEPVSPIVDGTVARRA